MGPRLQRRLLPRVRGHRFGGVAVDLGEVAPGIVAMASLEGLA